MKITVDCIIRAQPTIRRMDVRHVGISNPHCFLDSVLVLSFCIKTLAAEIPVQQHTVIGLEQNTHRGTITHVRIEPNECNVLNHRGTHYASNFRLADGDLLLHAFAIVMINALVNQHIAKITLPVTHEVAVPEIVRKVAKPHIETFVWHMGCERLNSLNGRGWNRELSN